MDVGVTPCIEFSSFISGLTEPGSKTHSLSTFFFLSFLVSSIFLPLAFVWTINGFETSFCARVIFKIQNWKLPAFWLLITMQQHNFFFYSERGRQINDQMSNKHFAQMQASKERKQQEKMYVIRKRKREPSYCAPLTKQQELISDFYCDSICIIFMRFYFGAEANGAEKGSRKIEESKPFHRQCTLRLLYVVPFNVLGISSPHMNDTQNVDEKVIRKLANENKNHFLM